MQKNFFMVRVCANKNYFIQTFIFYQIFYIYLLSNCNMMFLLYFVEFPDICVTIYLKSLQDINKQHTAIEAQSSTETFVLYSIDR